LFCFILISGSENLKGEFRPWNLKLDAVFSDLSCTHYSPSLYPHVYALFLRHSTSCYSVRRYDAGCRHRSVRRRHDGSSIHVDYAIKLLIQLLSCVFHVNFKIGQFYMSHCQWKLGLCLDDTDFDIWNNHLIYTMQISYRPLNTFTWTKFI